VIGSSLLFSWLMDHDGVMRRSDEEFSEVTRSGTSAMITRINRYEYVYSAKIRVYTERDSQYPAPDIFGVSWYTIPRVEVSRILVRLILRTEEPHSNSL